MAFLIAEVSLGHGNLPDLVWMVIGKKKKKKSVPALDWIGHLQQPCSRVSQLKVRKRKRNHVLFSPRKRKCDEKVIGSLLKFAIRPTLQLLESQKRPSIVKILTVVSFLLLHFYFLFFFGSGCASVCLLTKHLNLKNFGFIFSFAF